MNDTLMPRQFPQKLNKIRGNMNPLPASIKLLGVNVTPLTVDQLHAYMAAVIQASRKEPILNVNVHCLNLAYEHLWLKTFLNSANVVFCDGAGVKLGARILGHHIPERITYADWIWQLAEFSEALGFTFFFLGAEPGTSELAAKRLEARFPQLRIVGTYHGYFDKRADSSENSAVIQKINRVKPNILVIGFGMPLQEQWLLENWGNIDANIALTGGAVFDYISGRLNRAPRWMTDNGFEWLGRLVIEPSRLWQRYMIGNPLFFWRILKQSSKK